MYQYVQVYTFKNIYYSTQNWYILVHTSYWVRKIDAAMTWYEGVHVAIHHIMESHAIV